jgi:replication factor C subunit 3/5
MIFHGQAGCGLEYAIPCFIKYIFKLDKIAFQPIPNANNKVVIKKSNVHYEIKLYVTQSSDKNILSSFIKEYCNTINMYNGKFNILVIYNYHYFSKTAECSLKRILEDCYETLRIIFVTNNISKMDPAIKSRCLLMRFPCATKKNIESFLKNKNISNIYVPKLVHYHNDINKFIFLYKIIEQYKNKIDDSIFINPYHIYIKNIIKECIKTDISIYIIRDNIYDILSYDISVATIFKETLNYISNVKLSNVQLSNDQLSYLIQESAKLEYQSKLGNKYIYYIELFFLKLYKCYHS